MSFSSLRNLLPLFNDGLWFVSMACHKQEGHEALNRSSEYTGQSKTYNFEI